MEIKKVPAGESKEIEVYETKWRDSKGSYVSYGYHDSAERFERPVKKAFRISVHESHREGGKVKKKQFVICTIGYYSIVDWSDWFGEYVRGMTWEDKVKEIGLPEEELISLIEKKWNPIVKQVIAEFQQTEEYKAKQEHQRIIQEHRERVDDFVKKYGADSREYDYCYDVFGVLRNPKYLEKIKTESEARREYEQRSKQQWRSYYKNFSSNYKETHSGSYDVSFDSNYTEEERGMLKQFYRVLSKKYHPDSNPDQDTSAQMKLLNELKQKWGV